MMNPLFTVGMNSPIFICASFPGASPTPASNHRDAARRVAARLFRAAPPS
jgi:hypothetical protein